MNRATALLALATLASALAVVELRHRNRAHFAELQALQKERDALDVEWDQLLLEQGTWAEHRKVERLARSRLDLAAPQPGQIVVLRPEAPGKP
jgi:cell division protein FtsL